MTQESPGSCSPRTEVVVTLPRGRRGFYRFTSRRAGPVPDDGAFCVLSVFHGLGVGGGGRAVSKGDDFNAGLCGADMSGMHGTLLIQTTRKLCVSATGETRKCRWAWWGGGGGLGGVPVLWEH